MMDMYALLMGGNGGDGGGGSGVVVYSADPDGVYITTEATWQDINDNVADGKLVLISKPFINGAWTGIAYMICSEVSHSTDEYAAGFIENYNGSLQQSNAMAESADGYLFFD